MAEGQLRCAGSSLFLKKKYGVGYQLTIEKGRGGAEKKLETSTVTNGDADTESKEPPAEIGNGCVHRDSDLKKLVESAVPEATLLSDVGTELRYQLPLGAASKFPTMFEGLDKETANRRITSYGVSMTTLGEPTDHAQFCFRDVDDTV